MTTYYVIARNYDGSSKPMGTYDNLIKARAKAVSILKPRRNDVEYVTVQDTKYASTEVSKYVKRGGKNYIWTIYNRKTGFKHYLLYEDGKIERTSLD